MNNTFNALIVVAFALLLIASGVKNLRKDGIKTENAIAVIGGIVILFFTITAGFWPVVDLGYKLIGKGAEHADVDNVLSDGIGNVLDGDLTGMSNPVHIDGDGDADKHSYSNQSSGPASDSYSDDGVNVEIVKPTPVPSPTAVRYDQKYAKPIEAWGNWFRGNHFHTNGDATSAEIPIGVRCQFSKDEDPVFGPQKWTMTCNDRDNSDYGIVKIPMNEAAVKGIGGVDGKAIDGTGDLGPRHYPKGVFIQIGDQSQAPAFAPGPASATSGNGPDVFASQFAGWLVVDSPSGIDCVWDNGSKLLPAGSRHRFDPKSLRNNSPGQIPQVEILMNTEGATCWGVIWRGRSHFE